MQISCGNVSRAPKLATIEWYQKNNGGKLPNSDGLLAGGIPGVVDAWYLLLDNWGTMSLEQVLHPAIELAEQGFYEVRAQGRDAAPPMTVASNVDLSESDLTPMDPQEVVAGVLGRAGGAVPAGTNVSTTDQEQEKNQRVWWYLLFAGIVILGLETLVGNRISRSGPVQV